MAYIRKIKRVATYPDRTGKRRLDGRASNTKANPMGRKIENGDVNTFEYNYWVISETYRKGGKVYSRNLCNLRDLRNLESKPTLKDLLNCSQKLKRRIKFFQEDKVGHRFLSNAKQELEKFEYAFSRLKFED